MLQIMHGDTGEDVCGRSIAGWVVGVIVSTAVVAAAGCELANGASDESERSLEDLPSWSLEEELRLGDPDLPDGFSRVADVGVGPDGGIFVLDGAEHEVRVFDPDGRAENRFGGQGEGPGELLFPSALGIVGDTLWVRNGDALRLTLFSLDGELLRTVSLDEDAPQVLDPDGVPIRVSMASLGADGYVHPLYVFPPRPENLGPWSDSVEVPRILFDAEGELVESGATTTAFPGSQMAQIEVSGFQFPVQRSLFQDFPLLIEDASSRRVVYRWVPSSEDDARIRVTASTGIEQAVEWEHEYTFDPVPLGRAEADSIIRALAERHQANIGQFAARAPPLGALEEAVTAVIDVPPFLPPVTAARRAVDGSMWLRRETFGRDPVRWTVISDGGRPLAEVDAPRVAEVQLITNEHVWAVVPDDLDVPYVVAYRIVRDQ